jgi:hypothetical protein
MPERSGESDDLFELLADALIADAIEMDLLLRYSREPDSLGANERQRVEVYLAASPAHRDRLRVRCTWRPPRHTAIACGY